MAQCAWNTVCTVFTLLPWQNGYEWNFITAFVQVERERPVLNLFLISQTWWHDIFEFPMLVASRYEFFVEAVKGDAI